MLGRKCSSRPARGKERLRCSGKSRCTPTLTSSTPCSSTTGRARGQPTGVLDKDRLQNREGPGICCISSVLILCLLLRLRRLQVSARAEMENKIGRVFDHGEEAAPLL